jgi:hypothetical protein
VTQDSSFSESLWAKRITENLNQIGSRKGDQKDEANDEREAIGDCSDARKISESRKKLKCQILVLDQMTALLTESGQTFWK